MMIKGQDASHIVSGNSFDEDGHKGATFDYCFANPPFGGSSSERRSATARAAPQSPLDRKDITTPTQAGITSMSGSS